MARAGNATRRVSLRSEVENLFRSGARLQRIPELDGLRALLAWWVVVYHARGANFSAGFEKTLGPLAFLSQGGLAVDVFMILSGFVIFVLLDREHEGYRPFTIRRFMRLYPVYVVCLVAMLFLQGVHLDNLRASAAHLPAEQLASMLRDAEQPMLDLGPQLAVHALMLHGMIPETWLPNAPGAFLMPAWSISLEWQFYLVAPLAFWLIRRHAMAGAAIWLALTALAFATRPSWPPFDFDAFLPLRLHLFTIGIASYYVYKAVVTAERVPRWLRLVPLAAVLGVVAAMIVQTLRLGVARGTSTGTWWFPLAIWAIALAMLLAIRSGAAGPLARTFRRLLAWSPLERLGVVSYSTYLAHWPVLVVCQALFLRMLDRPSPAQLLLLHVLVSFPLIAAVSFAMYRWVERPGMALGRRLAQRA